MPRVFSLAQAEAAFIEAKQAAGKSANTIRNYRVTFAHFAAFLEGQDPPLAEIDADLLTGFLAWLQAETFEPDGAAPRGAFKLAAKTILNMHTDLSALWAWAADKRLVTANIVRGIEAPDPKAPVIEPFTEGELRKLLDACARKRTWKQARVAPEDRPTGDRDRAIILLLIDTGLRASELCDLKREDLNMAAGSARVLGKGAKERIIQIGKRAQKALWPLLTAVPEGEGAPYVFTVGSSSDSRPMSRYMLGRLLKRLGDRAGVRNVYPHRFRHTFAITYLRNDGDLFTLQALLGHSDLAMVRRYAQIAQMDCARVHAKASPVDNWKL